MANVKIELPGEMCAKLLNDYKTAFHSNPMLRAVVDAYETVLDLDETDAGDMRVHASIMREITKNLVRDYVVEKYKDVFVELHCHRAEKANSSIRRTVESMFRGTVSIAEVDISQAGAAVHIPFDNPKDAMRFKLMLPAE